MQKCIFYFTKWLFENRIREIELFDVWINFAKWEIETYFVDSSQENKCFPLKNFYFASICRCARIKQIKHKLSIYSLQFFLKFFKVIIITKIVYTFYVHFYKYVALIFVILSVRPSICLFVCLSVWLPACNRSKTTQSNSFKFNKK